MSQRAQRMGIRTRHHHRRRCHPRHLVPRARAGCRTGGRRPPRPSSRRWPARTRCAGSAASSCRPRSTSTPPPADASDAYLRLHLLSHRAGRAQHASTSTASSASLANVVWTNQGPCAVDGFEMTRARHARPRPRPGVRRRQVPADGRLRRARRGAHRRRRPRAPRRAPRLGHHRDARGLRELQRRHPRHLDGRGPDLSRASSSATAPTSAAAPRSWAPSPAAAPSGVSHRRALPARRRVRPRHRPRRRLRRRGRPLRHRGHQGHAAATARSSRPASSPGQDSLLFRRNSVTGAVEAAPATGTASS